MTIRQLGQVTLVENALSNGNTITYKVYNGTYYHAETPLAVINALETARISGKRIKIWLGDKLGTSWMEECETTGTIGRSSGEIKVPLLIHNSRSYGGGALLDHCIIRITMKGESNDLYCHPKFNVPEMRITPSDLPEYFQNVEVKNAKGNFEIHARFKKAGQAERWIKKLN